MNATMTRWMVVVGLLAGSCAWADWDPKAEAAEAARRQQAAAEQRKRQAHVQQLKADATMQHQRAYLGKEAAGKSDVEVQRLYDAKLKSDQAAANKAAAEAPQLSARIVKMEADTRGQRDDAVKKAYGKSLKDLENMSDAEEAKLFRDLERKYGK
jgi:hypothetical protein